MRANADPLLHDRARRGSMLIVAMGLGVACAALALSYLAVARLGTSGGRDLRLEQLAQQSARAGAAHALAATLNSYVRCASSPTSYAPTHYRQAWNLGFRAIDSLDADWNGRAGTAQDDNGNDCGVDESPLDMCLIDGPSIAARNFFANWGMVRTDWVPRWFEPGYWNSDPVAKPTSFHLNTRTSDLLAPSGNDPAVHYLPDTPDEGDYFDDDMLPLPASRKAQARYRLRYAVVLEDLGGHIAFNIPGDYQMPTPSGGYPATYPISPAAAYQHREIDYARLQRFLPGMSAVTMAPSQESANYPLQYTLLGLSSFLAMYTPYRLYNFAGTLPTGGPVLPGSPTYLSDVSHSGGAAGIFNNPCTVFNTMSETNNGRTYNICAFNAGPLLSYDTFRSTPSPFPWGGHAATAVYNLYAPHLQPTQTPTAGRDVYPGCDHPIQINVPTMDHYALVMMLNAHLPAEPRTYRTSKWSWYTATSYDANNNPNWTQTANGGHDMPTGPGPGFAPPPVYMQAIAATAAAGGVEIEHHGANFRKLLPGWDPNYPIVSPATDWSPDLGRDIDLEAWDRPKPLLRDGWDGTWTDIGLVPGDAGPLCVSPNFTHDNWEPLVPGGLAYFRLVVGIDGSFGKILNPPYVHNNSYWWDIHAALLHSLLVTSLAWHGDDGTDRGDWKLGRRPNSLKWPAGTPIGIAGAYVLDRDTDGDGQADTPSLLDSVEEVDRLFVRNMGEDFGPATGTPATGLRRYRNWNPGRFTFDPYTANTKLKLLRAGGGNGLYTQERINAMELVLNDTRMSFFGSSPQYPGFRPIDFDGDGKAWCSCYTTAGGTAYVRNADAGGFGVDPPDQRFTLTGNFVFRPSSFYRAFIRGEVFDQLKGRPAAEALLDTAFVVDADGSLYDVQGKPTADWSPTPNACQGVADSTILYQRWFKHPFKTSNIIPVVP